MMMTNIEARKERKSVFLNEPNSSKLILPAIPQHAVEVPQIR